MLRWRLLLGVVFIAVLVMLCWLDAVVTRPGAFLLPAALMLSWFAVVELLEMFNKRGRQPVAWTMYSGVLLTVLLAGMPVLWPESIEGNSLAGMGWLGIGLVTGCLLALVGELQRYNERWQTSINLGLSAFGVLYVGGLMGTMVQLRLLDAVAPSQGRVGLHALISLVAIVKMSDTGQYIAGRLFGRHKLSPLVSPGKTWEGAAGGVVFAVLTAWLMLTWGARQILGTGLSTENWLVIAFVGVALAVGGILGDLAESMLKRDAGVKDSSMWLPGFGGVLDLLDSLLGAAPIAYILWALGIVPL